jgi:hypothetical protein
LEIVPQLAERSLQVLFVQVPMPHTLGAPFPPQTSVAVQIPQAVVRAVPQLSFPNTCPQFAPWCRQNASSVSGAQTHDPAMQV